MKQLKTTSLAILFVMLLFESCTIQKRVHMSGYHIEWHSSNKSITKTEKVKLKEKSSNLLTSNNIERNTIKSIESFVESSNESSNTDNIIFSKSTSNTLNSDKNTSRINQNLTKFNSDSSCDLIILRNGQEIQAKVLEVGQTEVKYKNCDNLSGPTFTKSKSEIFMIKHPNGTNTVIEESKKKIFNDNSNTERNPSDKSLIVAVLLWWFLGIIGIHRFYLGHIGMGVLYLLTGALCGIGWLIDGILFLTGGLNPKNGKYID